MNRPINRTFLGIFCGFVILAMLGFTTYASLESNVWAGYRELFALRWGLATLMDAYFAFAFFYLWFFTQEKSPLFRVLYLGLLFFFGNLAIASYVLFWLAKRHRSPLPRKH